MPVVSRESLAGLDASLIATIFKGLDLDVGSIGEIFGGDKDKLGNIPGAAPILHYFYPHLPNKILKPFKPVTDLRAVVMNGLAAGNEAALDALGVKRSNSKVLRSPAVSDLNKFVAQRLFEVKFAAAAAEARKYQQRLLERMGHRRYLHPYVNIYEASMI